MPYRTAPEIYRYSYKPRPTRNSERTCLAALTSGRVPKQSIVATAHSEPNDGLAHETSDHAVLEYAVQEVSVDLLRPLREPLSSGQATRSELLTFGPR